MGQIEPEDLIFDFSMHRPGPAAGIAEEYPHFWAVEITASRFDEESDESEDVPVGTAAVYVIPEATDQENLFLALDPHSQELADLAEMLQAVRPDLLRELDVAWGRDLLYVSCIELEEAHRGHGLGRAVLQGILDGVGRYAGLVVLQAAPVLGVGAPEEGTPAHRSAKKALARYWAAAGFEKADDDWMFQLV